MQLSIQGPYKILHEAGSRCSLFPAPPTEKTGMLPFLAFVGLLLLGDGAHGRQCAVGLSDDGGAVVVAGDNETRGAVSLPRLIIGASPNPRENVDLSSMLGHLGTSFVPEIDVAALTRPQALRTQKIDLDIRSACFGGGIASATHAIEYTWLVLANSSVWMVPLSGGGGLGGGGMPTRLELKNRVALSATFGTEGVDCFTFEGRFFGLTRAVASPLATGRLVEVGTSGQIVGTTTLVSNIPVKRWTFFESSSGNGAFVGAATPSGGQQRIFVYSTVFSQFQPQTTPVNTGDAVKIEFFEDSGTTYAVLILATSDAVVWRLAGASWVATGATVPNSGAVDASMFRSDGMCLLTVPATGAAQAFRWDPSGGVFIEVGSVASLAAGTTPRSVTAWRSEGKVFAAVASYNSPSPIAGWRPGALDMFAVLGRTTAYAATDWKYVRRAFGGDYLFLVQDSAPSYLFALNWVAQ